MDEKKLNLERLDGLSYHQIDFRGEKDGFSTIKKEGGYGMSQRDVSNKVTISIECIDENMDLENYFKILRIGLITVADDIMGSKWDLMKDSESVHRSNYTAKWLDSNDVNVTDWAAKYPDVNIIKSVWGMMERKFHNDGR